MRIKQIAKRRREADVEAKWITHFVDLVENEKKAKNMRLAVAIFMRVTPNDQNGYVGPCQPNL